MSDDAVMTDDAASDEVAQEAPVQAETFGLEYVQQLRAEAAKYRNDRKTAVEAAKAATASEWEAKLAGELSKFAELEQAKTQAELEVLKFKTVLESEVPSDIALDMISLVQGFDEESISESVAKLKSVMGRTAKDRAVDMTQGSGNAQPLNGDPLLETIKRMVGA